MKTFIKIALVVLVAMTPGLAFAALPTSFPYSFEVSDYAATSTSFGNIRTYTFIDSTHFSCSDSLSGADHTSYLLWGGGSYSPHNAYSFNISGINQYIPCDGNSHAWESHFYSGQDWGYLAFGPPVSAGWAGIYDKTSSTYSSATSSLDYVFKADVGVLGWTFYNDFPVGPPPPTIGFHVPDGATTTPDFPNWETDSFNLSPSTKYRVDVVYDQPLGATGDFYAFKEDDFTLGFPQSGYTWLGTEFHKTTALTSPIVDPPYEWNATAYLYATSSEVADLGINHPELAIASSPLLDFFISQYATTATDTYLGIPAPSSTPPLVTACATSGPFFDIILTPPFFELHNPIPIIQSGVCQAVNYTFTMTPEEQANVNQRWSNIKTTVSSKPPLGYFTIATAALSSFSNGSTTVILMTATTTAAFSPLFSPLDVGLAACVGLLCIVWFIKRLKHIQP